MTKTVLIIAHNEEKYIESCITSILAQSVSADEIILVVHNSTDRTEQIARAYEKVKVIPHTGPSGITYARVEGMRHCTGDMIFCIDGDSKAAKNWIEEMSLALSRDGNTLVGSWIVFRGTLFGWISNFFNFFLCAKKNEKAIDWVWGPSFAFWYLNIDEFSTIFKESIRLSEQLDLSRNPDDFWMAFCSNSRGNIEVIATTHVSQHQKEKNSFQAIARTWENIRNGRKIRSFLKCD